MATVPSAKAKSARQSKLKQRGGDTKTQVSSFIIQKPSTGLTSIQGPDVSVKQSSKENPVRHPNISDFTRKLRDKHLSHPAFFTSTASQSSAKQNTNFSQLSMQQALVQNSLSRQSSV